MPAQCEIEASNEPKDVIPRYIRLNGNLYEIVSWHIEFNEAVIDEFKVVESNLEN